MSDDPTIREKIRHASPDGSHLEEETPDEPGIPEAVNLERDDPVTNAARRRDSFAEDEAIPQRARRAEASARRIAHHEE